MKQGRKQNGQLEAPNVGSSPTTRNDGNWEDKIDHLKQGYETAQNVIEFLDTKGNILIGLSALVAGFAASMVKWALELDPKQSASWETVFSENAALAAYSLILVGLSLLAFVAVVLCCLCSVIARKAARGKFTILFPIKRKDRSGFREAFVRCFKRREKLSHKEIVIRAVKSLDRPAILEEYSEQLAAIGCILENKLNHNRWASVAAVLQLLLFSAAIVLYFGAASGLFR